MLGSKHLYEYADNNPIFEAHPTDYTNHPFNISQNDKMVAINSAIEVDISGQVCSDSIGTGRRKAMSTSCAAMIPSVKKSSWK